MINKTTPNILITGAGGYIGSALRAYLSLQKIPFYSVDADRDALLFPEEQKCRGGITQFVFPDAEIRTVIHLAGLSGEVRTKDTPQEARNINIEGTKRIIDLAKKHGHPHLVFASTASVYDDGQKSSRTFTEKDVPNPATVYGKSKYEAEQIVQDASSDIPVTILRKAVVYGYSPHMRFDTLIHSFIYSSRHSRGITLFGDGKQLRPSLAMTHALQAYAYVLEHPPKRFARYNIFTENSRVCDYALRVAAIAAEDGVHVQLTYQKDKDITGYSLQSSFPSVFEDPDETFYLNVRHVWESIRAS